MFGPQERRAAHEGGTLDTRQRAHAVQDRRVETAHRLPVRVGAVHGRDRHRDDARRVESGIDGLQPDQAAHEEHRARGHDDGQRDLHGHDRRTQAGRSRPHDAAPLLQRARHGLDARRLQGGHEAEESGRGQRGQAREGEGVEIQLDLVEARQGVGRGRAQRVDRPAGQEDAEQAARGGNHEALRQELRGQPAASRAQRRANRDLPLAGSGADEHEVGDVRAGDQHHERDHGQQDEERAPQVGADDRVVDRPHGHGPPAVRVRVRGLQAGGHRLQLGPRRRHRDSGPDAREHAQVAPRTVVARAQLEGRPGLGGAAGNGEARRHDARDRVRLAVEGQRAADRRGIATERALPEGVRDHDRVRIPARAERMSQPRRHAEQPERPCRHRRDQELRRLARARPRHRPRALEGGHGFQAAALTRPVERVRRGYAEVGQAPLRMRRPYAQQAIRLGIGQRPQDHAVDDGEHRGGNADAEGHGQDRGERESGAAAQGPDRLAQVVENAFHDGPR